MVTTSKTIYAVMPKAAKTAVQVSAQVVVDLSSEVSAENVTTMETASSAPKPVVISGTLSAIFADASSPVPLEAPLSTSPNNTTDSLSGSKRSAGAPAVMTSKESNKKVKPTATTQPPLGNILNFFKKKD